MSELIEEQSVDRTVFEVVSLSEEGDDRAYWQSKTPAERLLALEIMRQIIYGYDPSTTRLQRVFEVASGRHQDLADLEHLPQSHRS